MEYSERGKRMKATGVVRGIDSLGRFVIPIEIRKTMDLKINDNMEIFVDGDRIILKKYNPACIFCGEADEVIYYKGKMVCAACIEKLTTIPR